MKILTLFISLLFSINLLIFPVSVFGQDEIKDNPAPSSEKIDVYALFWPIVPGRTNKDSMFWVKQLKESVGDFFSFGDINKSQYQITLSEKRLVESYKLFIEDKDFDNAEKTLDMNKTHRDSAVRYMKKAQEEQRKVGELKARLVTSLENQQLVLNNIIGKIPEDRKNKIETIIEQFTLQISEAK